MEARDQGAGGLGKIRMSFVGIFYSAVLVHNQCGNQAKEPAASDMEEIERLDFGRCSSMYCLDSWAGMRMQQ